MTKGCGVCMAPEELDRTDQTWPRGDCYNILHLLRLTAEYLNCAGEVKRGKLKVIKEWEQSNRMRFGDFGPNSLLELVGDLHFHVTLFTPRDFLHAIILSLFGYNIVSAIIYAIESAILRPEFCSAHGGRPAPMQKSAVNNVLRWLAQRLASVRGEESCLTLTVEFAEHFLKVYAKGRSSFTGPHMNNLMIDW